MLVQLCVLLCFYVSHAGAGYCGTSANVSWYYRESDNSQTFGCTKSSCPGLRVNVHPNGEWSGGIEMTLTYKDCRAKDDLGAVICPRLNIDPSCTLFTPWGTRVTSCSDIKSFDSIFLVPPQKLAILPIREIRTEIQHIGLPIERENSLPKPIHMLTLSDRPRIVQFDNVATSSEIEMLHSYFENELPFYVGANARDERSVDEIDAVEVQGDVGLGLRKRLFDLLGIFPFNDALAEPLTIMRLNASQSLALTRDYLYADGRRADLDVDHNYTASNRFLTVLLVLSKAEAGGDFFLPDIKPILADGYNEKDEKRNRPLTEEQETLLDQQAERWDLHSSYFQRGSWARQLLHRCYASGATKALIPARSKGALAIYNQQPDGSADPLSGYAICPVLRGTLWLAKLQIWNAPRHFYAQQIGVAAQAKPLSVSATFESRDVYTAKLFWEDQLWEELMPGRPIKVNTFAGHRWHVRLELDDGPVITWVVGSHSPTQRFVLTARDLPVFNY